MKTRNIEDDLEKSFFKAEATSGFARNIVSDEFNL